MTDAKPEDQHRRGVIAPANTSIMVLRGLSRRQMQRPTPPESPTRKRTTLMRMRKSLRADVAPEEVEAVGEAVEVEATAATLIEAQAHQGGRRAL